MPFSNPVGLPMDFLTPVQNQETLIKSFQILIPLKLSATLLLAGATQITVGDSRKTQNADSCPIALYSLLLILPRRLIPAPAHPHLSFWMIDLLLDSPFFPHR